MAESEASDPQGEALPTVRAALRAVRREALKAAVVYALVDAAVVAIVVTGLLSTVAVGAVPETVSVPVPAVLAGVVESLTGTRSGTLPLSGPAAVGLGVAAVNAVVEVAYIARRDPIRWFERANPDTAEALRTARDAAGDDADDVMAAALYADVLDRLADSSGARLLDRRRLLLPLVVLALVAVGATQLAAVGFSVDLPEVGGPPDDRPGNGDGTGAPPPDGDPDDGDTEGGLAPGEDVLGDPTTVTPGTDPDDVVVDPGDPGGEVDRPYESGGFPSDAVDVEAERAGFAPPERIEDAELVRAYTLAILNETGGGRGG